MNNEQKLEAINKDPQAVFDPTNATARVVIGTSGQLKRQPSSTMIESDSTKSDSAMDTTKYSNLKDGENV